MLPRHVDIKYGLCLILLLQALVALLLAGHWCYQTHLYAQRVDLALDAGAKVSWKCVDDPLYARLSPQWLVNFLGDEYFSTVTGASFEPHATDAEIESLRHLSSLKSVQLAHTQISDSGLESLMGLGSLEEIDLRDTHVTPAGVTRLQQALPACKILR